MASNISYLIDFLLRGATSLAEITWSAFHKQLGGFVVQIDEQSNVKLRRSKLVWRCLWCVLNYFKFTFIHILRHSAKNYVLFSSRRRNNELQFVEESNRDCQRHRILQAWIWDEICSATKNQRIKDSIHKAHTPNEHTSIPLTDRELRGKVQLGNHQRPVRLHVGGRVMVVDIGHWPWVKDACVGSVWSFVAWHR
jgi:hypothetical protein